MTDAARIATRVVLPFALGVAALLGAFATAATYVLDRAPERREAVRVAAPAPRPAPAEEWPEIRDGVPALKSTLAKAAPKPDLPKPDLPKVEVAAKLEPKPEVARAAPVAMAQPAPPEAPRTVTPARAAAAAPKLPDAKVPVADIAVPLPPPVPVAAVPPAETPRGAVAARSAAAAVPTPQPVAAPVAADMRPALPVTEAAQVGQTASFQPPPSKPAPARAAAVRPVPEPAAQPSERKPKPERAARRKEPTRQAAAQPAEAAPEPSKGFDLGLPDLASTGQKIRDNVEAFGNALLGRP